MRAAEGLEQAATGVLRRMAVAHGLPAAEATTRAELVEHLARRFTDPEALRSTLDASLSPEQRVALGEAARAGGGEVRGFLLARMLAPGSGPADPDAIRPLVERGLLFRTFAPLGPHRGEVYAVPEEVLALLGEGHLAEEAPSGLPAPSPSPPRPTWRAGEPAFSLFTLASVLYRQAERTRDAGARPAEQSAQLRAETAGWADEPGGWAWQDRWQFLRHLATRAGLLGPLGEEGEDSPVRPLFAQLLGERPALLRRVWQAYLRDAEWPDLVRAGLPRAEALAEQVDGPSLRASLAGALRRLPPGEWFGVEALVAWLRRAMPTFLREQLDSRSLSLTDPDRGGSLWTDDAWERLEAPLLRYLLLGPFYWLGIVGADADGQLVAVGRAGAALLGAEAPASRPPEACNWEDDTQLVVPTGADLGLLLRAERYLRLEQRGLASRYALDQAAMAAALAAGGSVAECGRLLVGLAGREPPPGVQRRLAEWQQRQGAYTLRPMVVLESATPQEHAALADLPDLRPLLRREVGPTAYEVPAAQAAEVAERLRQAGHLPRLDAALQLMAGRRAYASLVDQQVLEFLLVSLLAFQRARPEHLAQLEGAARLLSRLEALFPPEQLRALREAAATLAGELEAAPGARRAATRARRAPRRPRTSA